MTRHSFTFMGPEDFQEINRVSTLLYRLLTKNDPKCGPCIYDPTVAPNQQPIFVIFSQTTKGAHWQLSIYDARVIKNKCPNETFSKEYKGHEDRTMMSCYSLALDRVPYHLQASGNYANVAMENGLSPDAFAKCVASNLAMMIQISAQRDFFVGVPKGFRREDLDRHFHRWTAIEFVPQKED